MVYKALWGPSVRLHTSSISIARSARDAWVTHFSTTLLDQKKRKWGEWWWRGLLKKQKAGSFLRLCRNEKKKKFWKTCLCWILPGKLVLAEPQYVASNLSHYLALILSSAMLQNVLDHIVAILVLNTINHTDTLNKTWGHQLVALTSDQTISQLQKSGGSEKSFI